MTQEVRGWSMAQVAQVTSARHIGQDLAIEGIATDTRLAISPGALFVALSGQNFDAHTFLEDAYANGATMVMVHDEQRAREVGFEHILVVSQTTDALQQWARAHRARFDVPVVGITGSNGKTIVKEMLASILARQHTVYRSPGSFNSQVGVALTLLGIAPEHDVVLVEAGISQSGEMDSLAKMIHPTVGVLTNIGLAHAAGLNSLETTLNEKRQLFSSCQRVILPASDAVVAHQSMTWGEEAIWYAADEETIANISMRNFNRRDGAWAWEVLSPQGAFEVNVHSAARHDVDNAMAALTCALHLGATIDAIEAGLLAWDVSPMRVEIHTTPQRITLINDAYSADPVSMRHALQTLKDHAGLRQRKVVIVGDMLDLGQLSEQAHKQLGQEIASMEMDQLFGVGPWSKYVVEEARTHGMVNVKWFESLMALQHALNGELAPDDVVLFKGSRAMGLERVAASLLESVGPTRLVVSLSAVAKNYHALKRHVGAQTKIMAVVKSYGYGNDATRISKALVREGVEMLAVAYADEAIPLRQAGLQLPILVLNTLASEVDKLVRYNLTGLVYTRQVAQSLANAATQAGVVVPVHMKINTGMNRAGLKPNEALEFGLWLQRQQVLKLTGVMTHFTSADEAHQDTHSLAQMRQFDDVLATLKTNGLDLGVVHAANTSAAWRFEQSRYDMVRFGLGLYGLHPSDAVGIVAKETSLALRFVTQIIHVHDIEAGESVGYGQSWTAQVPTRLATIAAGYNDGFPRYMSNGGHVLIHGQRCEVVGRVCMDVSVVDVTHLKDVAVGNEVVLFGHQKDAFLSVNEMACRGNTISYEILCNISPRVRRIFVHAS